MAGCCFVVKADTKEVPKNELRSAWLPTISTATSWPGSTTGTSASIAKKQQESLVNHIERMVKYNCNALSFQVRPMGDALYKSSCEPWSHYLTGKRGTAPTYDPLEFFIKECHARGIEAHAWVNPFRLKRGATPLTAYDQAHIDKGWTIEYTHPEEGSTTIFDPGNPEVRKYIVDRVMEVVNNYDIDGVMFDDYFYCPGLPANITSGYDYDEYKASGTSLSLADWRRENVNKMIAETYAAIKAAKPWVRFGLSPRGIGGGPDGVSAKKYGLPACPATAGDGMYNSIFCDPLAWMSAKTIDYISPQIYWPTTQANAPYQPITNWWVKVSDKLDVAFYSSVGAYRKYTAGEMAKELQINRDENNDGDNGVVFYAAGDMDSYDSELKAAFPTKALVPPLRAQSPADPGKISTLQLNGNTLSCTPLEGVRYAFYAVPKSVTGKEAASGVTTGLKAEYLLGFSYEPTFNLPDDKIAGYWYAVTPYDRYGYEWEATTLGMTPAVPGPVPTLIAPQNGTLFTEGDVVLEVEKIADATTQIVQVATDENFKQIVTTVKEPAVTEGNNLQYVIPVVFFKDGKYYWRSVAKCDGKDEGVSEVRDFSVERVVDNGYTLTTDGELYDFTDPASTGRRLRLQSLWIRSENHGNPLDINDKQCRDFTVCGDIIYVAHMESVGSTSAFRLFRYKAATGAEMTPLELIPDGNYTGFYAPLTTVTTDNAGNLIISGLALNANSKLVVGKVDTASGNVTTVVSLPVTARIDHIDVIGDVDADFYVIAASGTTSDAYRWHVVNGEIKENKSIAIGVTPGTAPRVQAVSENGAFIDGSSTQFHYYDFNQNKATGKFATTKQTQANGGAYFTLDGMSFLVYPHSTFSNGVAYSLDYGPSLPASYDNLTNLWQFTPKGFGTKAPAGGDYGALAEVHTNTEGLPMAHIYTYAANNSLAAYKLDYASSSDVDVIDGMTDVRLTMTDGVLDLGTVAEQVSAYNVSGVMVAHAAHTRTLSLKGQSGLLIVSITVDGQQKTVKILL